MSEVIKGSGILATINGHTLAVGNRRLMDSEQIPLSQEASEYAEDSVKEKGIRLFLQRWTVNWTALSRFPTKFVKMLQQPWSADEKKWD